jgi:hypothetical protein
VGALAVLAQALAVVRHREDERAREEAPLLESAEEPPELLVGEGDLTVVQGRAEARGEFPRRLVGRVGVVVVDPQEKGAGLSSRASSQRSAASVVASAKRSTYGVRRESLPFGRWSS